jgi:hypothetical protein
MAPQALWSAAARRRFHGASLLASYPVGYCLHVHGQQASRAESGSKLPHSKAGSARKILSCHTDSLAETVDRDPDALHRDTGRVRGYFRPQAQQKYVPKGTNMRALARS